MPPIVPKNNLFLLEIFWAAGNTWNSMKRVNTASVMNPQFLSEDVRKKEKTTCGHNATNKSHYDGNIGLKQNVSNGT